MSSPLDGEFLEDQSGPGKMRGYGDNFSGVPPVVLHNARGETGIMNRVHSPRLDEDGRRGNALRPCGPRHYFGFDKIRLRRSSGENDAGRDAALVFANSLGHPRELQRCWIAIAISGRAEHNDGVET